MARLLPCAAVFHRRAVAWASGEGRARSAGQPQHQLRQSHDDHHVDRLTSRAEFPAARQAIEARIEATGRALSERPRPASCWRAA